MPKGFTFVPAMALAALLALPTPSRAEPGVDTVVARVNGQEITIGHMIVAHATLPQQYQQLPPDVLYDAILNQLIQQSALQQSQTGEEPLHVRLSLENEKRSMMAADAIETVMAGAATEEEIKAAYDARYGDGFGAEEYSAAHILLETEEAAKAVREEIVNGADFAEVAKAKSTGPSGPSGGDLGWFSATDMVPEFSAAVVAMEPGAVSEPVQTKFGWHIIKLNEKRRAEAPALEAVSEEIAMELRKAAVEKKVEELTAAATVERPEVEGLDPTVLRNLDLIRN
ncbi:peptidylprolyl isomerase [Seohaeicola zhoushanensis]|uniref:Parvulin-like PPIase n=1 Tax=Seohaeicola zhoushanensis TaxID=1569283 RepID=A0A8J3GTJ4_9RHOB|nr:peptidylprolyl isomerase [Seohaeicola zhoushanensis]GHF33642.1 peptidylprolyl isomerase [Seohaeicola zhoushanensis]